MIPSAMKDTKKKWEDELRAQVTENEREIQRIRSPKQNELPKVDEVMTEMVLILCLSLFLKLWHVNSTLLVTRK